MPSRRQAVALITTLVVVAGAIAAASFLARPDKARAFDLFYGSVYINDATAPVAIDLASGKPMVQLVNAVNQVSAPESDKLHVVPLAAGTLLLNTVTGEFNMLDATGFVLKGTGGGVQLPPLPRSTAAAVPSGELAYIVQSSPARTAVYLVSASTVGSATDKTARARATYEYDQGSSDVEESAVGANGDLWLLTGGPSRRTIRQLHLPADSKPGVELQSSSHGSVSGAAAVAVSRDPQGMDAVAVASAAGIDVFGPSTDPRHATLPGLRALDLVLPAHGQEGGFAFLLHDANGWALATEHADGSGFALHRISGLPPGSQLIAPGFSEGALYTMDTATGRLWRISMAGAAEAVPGRVDYPLTSVERPNHFDGASVITRGARAIINAPQHNLALTVFTDGSSEPVVIDKRSAISVSPTGPSLSGLHASTPDQSKPTQPPKETPKPATPVNEKIDCKKVSQVPHQPVVQLDERGSRTVRLSWTYPQLTPQDCLPSTYTVTATVTAGQAPAPPAPITVQGSTGVILTGLFPDTQYQLVVTAYINGQGTTSQPLPVRTSVEGPAAPPTVQATTDNAGNWNLSWTSCGGVQNGCVPTAQWRIVPQICGDAPGLVASPAVATVAGDPTLSSFTYVYAGGSALLGRGLSFLVQGVGQTGVLGSPGTATTCTYSWQPPNPAAITVAASRPPATSVGGSSSITANLTFAGDPDVAAGGVGGQFTYQLLSGGSVVSTIAPSTQTSAKLTGVLPGQTYQVQVVVTPPRHPEAAISLPPVEVKPAYAIWPAITIGASVATANIADGTLSLTIAGLSSAQARGETFDLVNSSLTCGNASMPLEATGFDPATTAKTPLAFPVNRALYYGDCTVTIGLGQNKDTATDPLMFDPPQWSGPNNTAAVPVPSPALDSTAADFHAAWAATPGSPAIVITYSGGNTLLNTLASDWSVTVTNGTTADCGTVANHPPPTPVSVTLSCLADGGVFAAKVSFSYFGQTHTFTPIPVTGSAPPPLNLKANQYTATFEAALVDDGTGTRNAVIDLTYNGDKDLATNGTGWIEKVLDPSANPCGTFNFVPTGTNKITVAAACLPPTPTNKWTIEVTYTEKNTGESKTITVTVSNAPPTA